MIPANSPRSQTIHTLKTVLITALPLLFLAGSASSQVPEAVRLQQTERQAEYQPKGYLELPQSDDNPFDVGGWVTYLFFDFRDDDHQAGQPDLLTSLFQQDYRIWLRGAFGDKWSYYARARHLDFRFATAAGVPAPDTRSQENPQLDLLFFDYKPMEEIRLRLGRQFVRVGRGLVLARDLDAVELKFEDKTWTHRLMAGRSLERDPNIDSSIVGSDRETEERYFYLAYSDYKTTNGDKYYGYLLVQRDQSNTLSATQRLMDFHYDSEYVGMGTEGTFNPQLNYFLELVHQSGDLMANIAGNPRIEIDATGLTSGLLWYPKWKHQPLLSLEYAFGGGDRQRQSVTNVFGGKLNNSPDRNFNYFGFYNGGLALAPRLSNLHVLRLGAQIKPFPRPGYRIPELQVGGKVSLYRKDTKDGIISDPGATIASKEVGTGLDVYAGYKPFSDTSLLIQYGRFWPGLAFPSSATDPSGRWLVTTTLSF